MPGQMTDFMENKLADFFRAQTLTPPSNWYLALGSAASDSGFTELSGSGYARVAILASLLNFAGTQAPGSTTTSTGTSHASSNNGAASWGDPGAAWGTANFIGLFDASSSGNCWMYFPIPAIVITTGSPNPVEILAGALLIALGVTGGCADYLANKLIDKIFRAQSFSWPATLYLGLYTAAPSNAGGGTEVSAAGYARVALVPSLTSICGTQSAGSVLASSGTGGEISNNATLTFPAPTADWGTVTHGGIFDAASSGNLLFWGALGSPITVDNGGTPPSYADATLSLTLA